MVKNKVVSTIRLPEHPVGYLAILMALITGIIYTVLVPNVIDFSLMMAIIFALNDIGFLVGIILYLSNIWHKKLYILAAIYALATIIALFIFQGFSIEAFYGPGEGLNIIKVISKITEAILTISVIYLFKK